MDFMKVFDQTVKELKREVNLKVLKVPEIEQKVLDSTDNEPWGPHGSALVEIAQATKKFTECQMVMNVLWQRITETGKDWRYVYKALAVIEYLVAHGSERAVDEIIEHTFQISALTSFEYVEPSGKDMGTNVRKKAENIVNLLNNRDKIQEVRNKAAANRDKYVGLSSTGIKSGSAFYGSSSYQNSDHYGGLSGTSNRYRDNFKDGDHNDEKKIEKDTYGGSRGGVTSENQGATNRKDKKSVPVGTPMSKSSSKSNDNDNYSSVRAQNSIAPNNYEDDFDDFDPRGTTTSKAAGSSKQVDLFGQDLIGDLMDAPAVLPTENPPMDSTSSDVDLFADAAFVAAPPKIEIGAASQTNNEVDLFASKPAMSSASPTVDLFASTNPVQQPEIKSTNIGSTNTNIVDPFATVPLNNFDGSDLFGAFTSHSESATSQPSQISVVDGNQKNLGGNVSADLKAPAKKDSFQVKSGIWADSLSRGLIDLNISAPKKVNLADIGVVGELTDGSDGKEKGPTTSYFMGRAMGAGSGLGRSSSSEFAPSKAMGGDDFFSSLNGTQYQYGGFQK